MHACECQNAQERDTPGASCSAGVVKVWIWRTACDPARPTMHHAVQKGMKDRDRRGKKLIENPRNTGEVASVDAAQPF